MLAASTSQMAETVARFVRTVELTKDRSQTVMINGQNFGADIPIMNDMKSLVFSRPSASEVLTPFGSDIYVTFDDAMTYKVPPTGLTILPLASQARTFKITAPSAIPAGWALYVLMTNRLYMVGVNL
jgi:hypothetical protein